MKEKIGIMTDVNAGLDYIDDDLGITVLRSIINFGDEHYIDGIDMRAEEFYERLKTDTEIPSTSAPTIGAAMDAIQQFVDQGYTDVIMFAISAQLSSIYNMVKSLETEYAGAIRLHVVDTRTAGFLQGYLALNAQQMANAGASVEEILHRTQELMDHSSGYFVVDNLNYLVKNGRLSGFSGAMGTLFKIKPLLVVDGTITVCEKIRTHQKAVARAIEKLLEDIERDQAKEAFIMVYHTVRLEDAKNIAAQLEAIIKIKKRIEIHTVTPAVGAHIGYGILGLGYFKLA